MKISIALFAVALGLLAIWSPAIAQVQSDEQEFASRLQIGAKAPPLDIEHWLTEPDKAITEFKPGNIYVIDFWGTWCGACIGEMPELAEIQKEFADQNVTIISVTDETTDEVKAFLERPCHHDDKVTYRELTSSYRLAADPDGSVFNDYMKGIQKRSFPMMAIVGKKGLIEYIGSTNGLKPTLTSIVADKWDRDYIRKEQLANWKARETMLIVNEFRGDGKIDEAIEVLNLQFEQAILDLRTISYRLLSEQRPGQVVAPEVKEKLESEFRSATIECMRWERNRFGFLLSQRSSGAVEPFRNLVAAYEGSPAEQINLAWRVYVQCDEGTEVDKSLMQAARDVAKAVTVAHSEDAIYLDVYAHLLHACGETDAANETFKLALTKATDKNRKEIQTDFDEFLKSTRK